MCCIMCLSCTSDLPLVEDIDYISELPWLKDRVDEITLLAQQDKTCRYAIYKCVYGDKQTGFLEEYNQLSRLYNIEGKIIAGTGGIAGSTWPEELKIDLVNKKLIWKLINN